MQQSVMSISLLTFISLSMFIPGFLTPLSAAAPFTVKTGLFDQSKPDDLGLIPADGTETITIFKPTAQTDHFTNGVVMIGFKDYIYCQWQSSKEDEDASDTKVVYSRSQDGKKWSEPMVLAPTIKDGYRSSAGWWKFGDTLVAYANVWPSSVSPRGGYTEYTVSTDGLKWSELKKLPMADGSTLNGIFEQDPHALPDGRIINAAHFQPGLMISPIYTDDPSGIRGWKKASFTSRTSGGSMTSEIEPSWFLRSDGAVVMVFRDQNSSFTKLASVSTDKGETWTKPVETDMPDSRSKQCAGNLPDGTAYLAGNPVKSKPRIPLAIAFSKDGNHFDKAYLLRSGGKDHQAQVYTGKSKGVGFSYPKSTIWNDYLYISYATNKEDAECTRIPLSSIRLNTTGAITNKGIFSKNELTIRKNNRNVQISARGPGLNGDEAVRVVTLNGQVIYNGRLCAGELCIRTNGMSTGLLLALITTDDGRVLSSFFEN